MSEQFCILAVGFLLCMALQGKENAQGAAVFSAILLFIQLAI